MMAATVTTWLLVTLWMGEFTHNYIPGDQAACDSVGTIQMLMAKQAEPKERKLKYECVPLRLHHDEG